MSFTIRDFGIYLPNKSLCQVRNPPREFNCTFTPLLPPDDQLATTGKLLLGVKCDLDNADQQQLRYSLLLTNQAEYRFAMGTGTSIDYVREAQPGDTVFLPFELINTRPKANSSSARMKLQVILVDPVKGLLVRDEFPAIFRI